MKEPAILWEQLAIGNQQFSLCISSQESNHQSALGIQPDFYRKGREGRKGLKILVRR